MVARSGLSQIFNNTFFLPSNVLISRENELASAPLDFRWVLGLGKIIIHNNRKCLQLGLCWYSPTVIVWMRIFLIGSGIKIFEPQLMALYREVRMYGLAGGITPLRACCEVSKASIFPVYSLISACSLRCELSTLSFQLRSPCLSMMPCCLTGYLIHWNHKPNRSFLL